MSPVVVTQTVQFSELSRSSKAVAEAADRGPVTITRRDGEPLVLQLKSDVDRDKAGLRLASQIIAVAVTDWPDSFAERLAVPFPWVGFLGADERESFATELLATARACASVSAFEPLVTIIHAWESTAQAYAQGYTRASDETLEWLDEPATVERPDA